MELKNNAMGIYANLACTNFRYRLEILRIAFPYMQNLCEEKNSYENRRVVELEEE